MKSIITGLTRVSLMTKERVLLIDYTLLVLLHQNFTLCCLIVYNNFNLCNNNPYPLQRLS